MPFGFFSVLEVILQVFLDFFRSIVSCRIRIPERIIERVRIPVETLRIGRAGDNRIGAEESA